MAQGKKIEGAAPSTVSDAWQSRDELAVIEAMIDKAAVIYDQCDSARDVNALCKTIPDLFDRRAALLASKEGSVETPLFRILQAAS